ncbi:MAG: ribonuclease P protein component [Chlorobi bacterium]|nr:ribonuclease P protein component [Chlorobiota bacterium]
MAAPDTTFPKREKLCSRKVINRLFAEGSSFVKYPFRIVLIKTDGEDNVPAKVLITVSKKRIKRANKRNLLKRRIKEAYRLNKHLIIRELNDKSLNIAVAFVYLPDTVMSFAEIEKGMKQGLNVLLKRIEQLNEK